MSKVALSQSNKIVLFGIILTFFSTILGLHYDQKSHNEKLQKETLKEIKALRMEVEKKDSLHIK